MTEPHPKKHDWTFFTKIGLVAFAILVVDAAIRAWDEYRFVAAFAEEFVAEFLHVSSVLCGPALGFYVGNKVFGKVRNLLIAWIVGIATCLVVWTAFYEFVKSIPGVDWRYERGIRD